MHWAIHRSLELLFPATCVSCQTDIHSVGQPPVCSACRSRIQWVQNQSDCGKPENIDEFYAATFFDDTVRNLIHAFKYKGKDYVTPLLVDILTRHITINPDDVDALVPVPISFVKDLQRGYNQAQLLADELGKRWGKPVLSSLLKKRFFSVSQVRFSRESRYQNAAINFYLRRGASSLAGKRILLIDDVLTSGATMNACAHLLKTAGSKRVCAATVAYEQ